MAQRDWPRFIAVALVAIVVMSVASASLPRALDVAAVSGLVASSAGLAVVLFAWHVWIQTNPGGLDRAAYGERSVAGRVTDFAIVIAVGAAIGTIGVVIGIEGGLIEADELWGGGTTSVVAETVVVIVAMVGGIYAGLARNRDIRITSENGRGE